MANSSIPFKSLNPVDTDQVYQDVISGKLQPAHLDIIDTYYDSNNFYAILPNGEVVHFQIKH